MAALYAWYLRIHYGFEPSFTEIAENDYERTIDSKSVVDQLIPFLAAGVAAD